MTREIGGIVLRMRSVLLVLTVVTAVMLPATALATQTGNGSYYDWVGQFTSTANDNGVPYSGWHGVKGYIHWQTMPTIWDVEGYDAVSSWIEVLRPGAGQWAQTGLTLGATDNQDSIGPWKYVENNGPNGYYYLSAVGSRVSIPGSGEFKVDYLSQTSTGMYRWDLKCNGAHYYAYLNSYVGCLAAESESKWTRNRGTLAHTYFGSNKQGWNGGSYALYGHSSTEWKLWNTSCYTSRGLPWTATVVEPNCSAFRFSPGYNYYYFGTWNN